MIKTQMEEDETSGSRRTLRRSQDSNQQPISWTYPKECNICKKHRVQHNGKRTVPTTIITFDAQETIKAAKDQDINLYREIKDLDLIAK